jgi:ubiquitin carboxyl-terminal hydrolase 34
LKDIPDNLIFHLKRFDFNLRTMQRSKINDYFSFPHRIDMRPYKVEYLMESIEQTHEDIYELVGVLVHAGTAESGHYYSYIRDRSLDGQSASWVEFNDDSVTPFDSNCIEANCFGGADYRGPDSAGSFQFDKSYSAYMLFYQRSTVVQAQQQVPSANVAHEVRLSVDRGLSNFIAYENELLVRKYCLYDEGHPPFVLRMLENVNINKGRCSEDHNLEKSALWTVLYHLDQVVCRTKDLPDFSNYMLMLDHKFRACAECAHNFLEWVIFHVEAIRQMLLRNPDQVVRNEISLGITSALNKVKLDSSYPCYGLYDDSLENDDDDPEPDYSNPRIFDKVVSVVNQIWESFHLTPRAWPEFFGLLINMASLGVQETATLLDYGFLRRTLEVISADPALSSQHPQYSRMLSIVSKRPITKPVSYQQVIRLLEVLLKAVDLNAEPIADKERRLDLIVEERPVPLSMSECQLLNQHWTRGPVNILVEKLLLLNQNERSTQAIIAMLLRGSDLIHPALFNAIRSGIRKVATAAPSAPFLKAALTYIEHADNEKGIELMIQHVTHTARDLDGSDGKDYITFLKDLLEIPTLRASVEKESFDRFVLGQIPIWAPSLLTYYDATIRTGYDATVRTETEDFIHQTVLRYALEAGIDPSPEAQEGIKHMVQVARQLGVACLRYLLDEHVRPRIQAVRSAMYSIHAIIDDCTQLYDETSEEELDLQFFEYRSSKSTSIYRSLIKPS